MKDRKRKKKIAKFIRITIFALFGLILVAGSSLYILLHSYIGKVNLISSKQQNQIVAEADMEKNVSKEKDNSSDSINNKTAIQENNGHDVTASKILEGTEKIRSESDAINETGIDTRSSEKEEVKQHETANEEDKQEVKQTEALVDNGREKNIDKSENISEAEKKEAKILKSYEAEIRKNLENDEEVSEDSKVKNILLFGSYNDHDSKEQLNSMVLLSMNMNTKKITTTYFYENCYLMIPGKGYDRLKAVFAYKDGQLLIDTLETNFKIRIDRYVQLDYDNLINLIDTIGGITVEIKEEEIVELNASIKKLNNMEGVDPATDLISEAGKIKLNGKQALAYSRSFLPVSESGIGISRQIDLLNAICKEFTSQDIKKLNEMLNLVLPQITTSFTEGEILLQLLSVPAYLKYDITQLSIPIKDSYSTVKVDGYKLLGIDFSKNIKELKRMLYQ